MDRRLSDKIKIAGLTGAVIVVLRHSLNLQAFFGGDLECAGWVASIELFVSKMTELAVPYFFAISGFFFLRRSYYSASEYAGMALSKMRTLLVPYVLWVLIGHVIMVLANEAEWPSSANDALRALWEARCAGVLWYVRTLVIMMMLYPVYGWVFVVDKWWLYAVTLGLSLYMWIPVDMSPLSSEGCFFFLLGGVAQKRGVLERVGASPLVLLGLCGLWLTMVFFSLDFSLWPNRLCTVCGVVVVWLVLDYAPNGLNRLALRFASMSFFLYVMHIYVLKTLKTVAASVWPGNGLAAILSFFGLAAITTVITIVMGIAMKRISPRLFGLLTGGRG